MKMMHRARLEDIKSKKQGKALLTSVLARLKEIETENKTSFDLHKQHDYYTKVLMRNLIAIYDGISEIMHRI